LSPVAVGWRRHVRFYDEKDVCGPLPPVFVFFFLAGSEDVPFPVISSGCVSFSRRRVVIIRQLLFVWYPPPLFFFSR